MKLLNREGTAVQEQNLGAQNQKILIVDDEELITQSICNILKSLNCTLFVAHNGRDAFRIVQGRNLDLVITDFVMPNGGGLEFTMKLTELNSLNKIKVPFILMSGNLDLSGDFSTSDGFMGSLNKPFKKEELLSLCISSLKTI